MTIDQCKLDILKQFNEGQAMGQTQFTISMEKYPVELREPLFFFLQRHIILLTTDYLRRPN